VVRHEALLGSNGGGSPSSPDRRSGRVKLAAAWSGGRRGGWEQPRQSRVGLALPDGPGPVSETGRYTRETGVDTSRNLDQLQSGGYGLGSGAHPSSSLLVVMGNSRLGSTGLGREVMVKVYGVAMTMLQG
jgi:hypothetical protein